MADNVAQSIKDLQKDLAALDKQLLSNNANWDKLGQTIVDSMKRGGLGIDDLFSQMKSQKDVLKLRAIIDRDALMKDVKNLQTAVDKGLKSVKVGGVEITGQRQIEHALEGYKAQLKLVPKTLAEAYDYAVKIANTLGGGKHGQQSAISKQRVKDEKDVQKIQEQTTASLQKRIELEERLKTLKPNGKAWREVKEELERVNKQTQEYLAKMGSLGTAGARQLKAYEKAGLITNADKQQVALERQQIDLLRQRMQAEEQLNRLLLQRNNATLAGKTVSPKVTDSISRLQERIDTIDKQRLGNYQNFTQTSLQRIEGMWQNHETALTNIKTQGAQSRQRILDRQTADEQKAIEQQRKLAQRYAEIESLRNQALGGKKYGELNKTELAQWQNFSTLLADVKKQMDTIESKHPGSLLKGQSLQSTDALLQQTKENIRQRDIESKRQAAAEEKRIERELAEDAKRAAKEKSDAEKQRAELEKQNIRDLQAANKAATQEADRLARAQAKARSAEAKQTFKRTDSESVSNLKRQAEIKQQIARIDHERQLRAKTNSQISTQQAEAERKSYSALQSELSKLISQQKERERLLRGTTAQASNKIGGYADRLQVQEAQRYRQELEKIGRQQEKNKRGLEDMLPTLRRLASAFGVAFSVQGLVNFGKKLVETRGEFELQQVALRSILQNKQLADEIWDKTMQAALQSPFTAMQLTKYTKQLAAYRIETDKLFDTTKRLADVSAGLGVDMQRLILAYGQVKAANYLRASEIRQFTEAGVNVLGELSNYFSETRGQMISTAQVMDMVQKRMVKFEDVEAIFKRLTDEGGIFYNMQYVQSQTVWGQLRKLRDAYDQMQNSIGKANEGVIKDFVSILNSAVQNWRGIAVTLKSIGWGVAIGWMSKYALALSGITAASMKTKRSIVSLRQGIEGFGKALKANLPMLAIGAAVALITRFVESARQMKQVNDVIDEQITTLYGASQQMSDYQSTIEKNNELIKSNGKEITDNKKRQEALNEALNSNSGIYAKLKNEYPQIAEQLKQNANGTIENTDALKSYNEQLEREMTLLAMREQKANIGNLWGAFSDSATEDLQDVLKNTTKVQTQIRNLQLRLKTDVAKMKASGNVDERQIALANEFLAIPTEGDMEEALKRANEIRQKYLKEYAQYVKGDIGRGGYKNLGELSVFGNDFDIQGLGHTLEEFRREMVNIGWIGDGDNLGKLETDFVGIIENFAGFAKSISDEYSGDVLDFVANNSEIIKKAVEGDAENGIEASPEIVKGIGDALIKAGFATTKEMQSVWNNLLNDRIIFTKKNEELNAIDAQIAAEEAKKIKNRNQQLLDDLRRQREDYIKSHGLDWFAGSSTTGGTNNQSPFDDNKKGKKSASKLISLIREMRAEYDKLSKSAYGYAKSEEKVRASFGDSWEAILKEASVPKDFDFSTNAGEIAALERVRDYVKGNAKFAKDAWKDVQKVIDQLKTESEIEVQVRIREDFGRQMEEAFGNYELTLDLQKLNLPSDVLSDLFNLDTVDLSDLRRKVVEFYNERLAVEADPTDLIKQVEGYYKKIDDIERKQQRDRIKDYAKYLEYELSERAKIEMEYTRKSADVAANQAFTSEQKEQIQKRLKEERDKAIAKQEWEDFKSSETYIQMMEDLEHQGTNALIAMRTELERIRENAENLSPRALKEVVNALEKIDEITIRRGMPISNIRNAAAGVRSARVEALESGLSWDQVSSRKAAKQTQADIKAQLLPMEQQFNILQSQLGAEKEIARLEQERYENGLKLGEIFGETFMTGDNEYLQELITNSLTNIESSQERINELTEQRKTASEADTRAIDQKLAEERANLECLEAERDLLEKQLELNIAIAKEALNRAATPEERASLQARINELEEELKKLREQDAAVGNLTKKYGILGDSVQDAVQKLAGWSQQAVDVLNSFKTMMTSLGVDTDTDAWDDWSTAFETIGAVASTAASMATKIASGDYIGAALDAAKGIMDIVTQWAGNNDRELERQIQKQQERIDALKDAYARLEKQIEKTWSSVTYMQTYEQQVANIREQIDAMEAQMRAEEAKKNTDDNAVRQYQRDIQDAYDQLEELEQKSIEVFGGIGEEGYRSAAEGFVDAWKSAFLETGDGLQGLQDHFNEFLQDWFTKQATMRIAGAMLEDTFKQIDQAVNKNGDGGVAVTAQELAAIRDRFAAVAPELSAALEQLAGMWDLQGEGSLSGLAAGIQGMTEEQANILEAYWNSVRMYTASIDVNVARIASVITSGGVGENFVGGRPSEIEVGVSMGDMKTSINRLATTLLDNNESTNPMLQQLTIIAHTTNSINTLLQSVVRSGHSLGGYGLKVFPN